MREYARKNDFPFKILIRTENWWERREEQRLPYIYIAFSKFSSSSPHEIVANLNLTGSIISTPKNSWKCFVKCEERRVVASTEMIGFYFEHTSRMNTPEEIGTKINRHLSMTTGVRSFQWFLIHPPNNQTTIFWYNYWIHG